MVGGTIVEIEEVGVVEHGDGAWGGYDALAEEVGEMGVEVATDTKVEIASTESIGVFGTGGGVAIVKLGTGFEVERGEDRFAENLGSGN